MEDIPPIDNDDLDNDIVLVHGDPDDLAPRRKTQNRKKRKRGDDFPDVDEDGDEAGFGPPKHLSGSENDARDPAEYLRMMKERHGLDLGNVNLEHVNGGIHMEHHHENRIVEEKSDIQRLLEAKQRRRRTGRNMAQVQVEEDLEDVKRFQAMSPEDKKAFLSIYEYDGTGDNLIDGLAKASSLALRVGLAYVVEPDDYDLASLALEMPDVKDSLALIWDCVDLDKYGYGKLAKAASAIGHIGDTILSAGMKLYQGVMRASDLRKKAADLERRREAGIQSPFDHRVVHQKQNGFGRASEPDEHSTGAELESNGESSEPNQEPTVLFNLSD